MRKYLQSPGVLSPHNPARATCQGRRPGVTIQRRMDPTDHNSAPSPIPYPSEKEPVLDLNASLQRLGGEASGRRLLSDLARFFLEDAPIYLGKLESALAAGNPSEAERMAHSIKGLAANFDGHPTHRAAQEVEKLAAMGNYEGAAASTQKLKVEVERLSAALASLLEPVDEPRSEPDTKAE